MHLKEYQAFAKLKWKPGVDHITLALGLGGETGEVLDIIKKARRDGVEVDRKHIKEELGDVFWYLVNLCTVYDFSIEELFDENVLKLDERYSKEKI